MPGETLDLDEVYERVLVESARKRRLFTMGKAGILWKLDRSREISGCKETIFQNVFTASIRKPASSPTARTSSSRIGKWVQACPSTEGGKNWQAMSYIPGADAI